MSEGKKKPNAFLAAMQENEPTPPPAASETRARDQVDKARPATRAGLKHIGGYLDRDTVEKVAILRARLGHDNSALLKLAIDDLFRKHSAQRTFGDA